MKLEKDFGIYGGQFVPETLMNVLKVLQRHLPRSLAALRFI